MREINVKFQDIRESYRMKGIILTDEVYDKMSESVKGKPIIDDQGEPIGYMTSIDEGTLFAKYYPSIRIDDGGIYSDEKDFEVKSCNFESITIELK